MLLKEALVSLVFSGVVAGGLFYAASGQPEEVEVGGRTYLLSDRSLLSLVAASLPLFKRIDPKATERLLDHLNDIVRLFAEATESKSPGIIAKALAARRQGDRCLSQLQSSARGKFPLQAATVSEDAMALTQAMTDYLHNIQQASALSMLRP
jgi:hypothetical protein